MSKHRPSLFALLGLLLVIASPIVTIFTFGHLEAFRVELGGSDDAFLLGPDRAWSRGYQDSGPYRIRRGLRWMTHFVAREAHPGAALGIPSVVRDGDAELKLRVHRYGRPGVVHVLGNGILLGSLVFESDSYPWDVRRLRVPEIVLRGETLRLDFQLEKTESELKSNALLAFDWVEIAPKGPTARLAPNRAQRILTAIFPVLVLALLWWARLSPSVAGTGGIFTAGVIALAFYFAPGSTTSALSNLWMVFPLSLLIWAVMRFPLRVEPHLARKLSTAFALVVLAHSTVAFFPNHLPPDLGPHLGQMGRLNDPRFNQDDFWEFSSSYGKTGRGKPHFGSDYEAPYPPWTYYLLHQIRRLWNHPRFLLEFAGLACGGLIMLLTYALARGLAGSGEGAAFAAGLAALEISTWHHASRAHTPGLVGEVFLLLALAYLVHRYEDIGRPLGMVAFAAAGLMATLAYTATLFHFVGFMFFFFLTDLVARQSLLPTGTSFRATVAAATGTLGSLLLFYGHFIRPALASKEAILSREVYRAPGRFFFLRNQMRDTVRILRFGYPAYVLLALPAWFKLKSWSSGELARRVVWAWTATYLSLLLLKDPVFFPQLFLHVKEDLFFAPLLCILGGMTLQHVSGLGRKGKALTAVILAVLFTLYMQDYLFNANTVSLSISSPPG